MEGLCDPPDDLSPRTSSVPTTITHGNSITEFSQNKIINEEEGRSNESVEHADDADETAAALVTQTLVRMISSVKTDSMQTTKSCTSKLSELEMWRKDHRKTKMENER